jgi:hypothetical protein
LDLIAAKVYRPRVFRNLRELLTVKKNTRYGQEMCQYFARYHILRDAHDLANELWGRFQQSNAL